MLSDMKIFGVL